MALTKVSRHPLLALLLAALCALGAMPAAAADDMSMNDARVVFERWIKAYESRDVGGIMESFDSTLVYSELGEADQSFDELKANYQRTFKESMPDAHWKVIPQEIHAKGDLAVVVSRWELRETSKDGKGSLLDQLRSVDVFKRTKAGWKIVRTFNYPELM